MGPSHARAFIVCVVLLLVWFAAQAKSASVFTAAEIQQLKAWSITPVAPSYVPAGFYGKAKLDPQARKYEITYSGPNGAYFVFEGASATNVATPAPKHHGNNLFKSIGSIFNPHHSSNSAGVAGEEEANPNEDSVAADSPLIGTTHFKETKDHCATGVSDKGIGTAKYTLTGCKTSTDDLVKVYRSATTIYAH